MKNLKLLLTSITLIVSFSLTAQMAITTDGSSADASAMLDIKSTSKGLLTPRMTLVQRDAIVNPAKGLVIYCTTDDKYYFNENVPTSPRWKQLNTPWTQNAYSAQSFYSLTYMDGSVGIGTENPVAAAILDITSTNQGIRLPRVNMYLWPHNPTPQGVMVYAYASPQGDGSVYFSNGSEWVNMAPKHYIGESYMGGIVYWVDETGQHGLIAPSSDQSEGCDYFGTTQQFADAYTYANDEGIGGGKMNTIKITTRFPGQDVAGNICTDFFIESNGIIYGGWHLPSKQELDLLCPQKEIVGGFNFDEIPTWSQWWSSTEFYSPSGHHAWMRIMLDCEGDVWDISGAAPPRVRCVKEF
jgi:hypothetical protein